MKTPFTPRKPRRYIGKYAPRTADGLLKASGRAEFLDDIAQPIRFPGMLYARTLVCPYPHARIRALDTSRAAALPGVHAILTCFDPEVQAIPATTHAWAGVGSTVPENRWANLRYNDQRILSDTFYSGNEKGGVAVAAESEAIAEEALRLLDIDWEILPFYLTPQEALQPDAAAIHPEINPGGNLLPADPRDPLNPVELDEKITSLERFFERGDVDAALASAEVTAEFTAHYHRADHACLDSMGCMMLWEGDQLVCYTNSYQADHTRMMIARMLGMPLNRVRVICSFLGASMGRWNTGDQSFFLFTALLAKRARRPVKYKHTRREDFQDTRLQITWTGKLGATRKGVITAADFSGLSDVGGHANHVAGILKYVPYEICERQLAHIPNLRLEGQAVYTNKIPGGMMRSTGNIQFNLMLSPLLDQMAEKVGMDPIDFLIKNIGQEWLPQPNESLSAVLREGARRIGWDQRHAPGAGELIDGVKKRGLGFSAHQCWHAEWEEKPRGEIQVGVKINPDLSVTLLAPTVETGSGANNVAVHACAEALRFMGVRLEDIRWNPRVDTETSLKDCVQTDSAVSLLLAELLVDVAQQVKAKLLELAARHYQAAVDMLDIDEGRVFFKQQPEKGMTVKDLLWWHADYVPYVPITVVHSRPANPQVTGVPYQATFVEVEVDIETGQVTVPRMVVVNDAGTVLHPTGAESHQVGGQSISLGEALSEEIIYDPITGMPLNFNFVDYKLLTIKDIPDIEPVLLEVWRGAGEYGAAGLAEGVLTNAPAAVLNAIYNAIGVRLNHIPVRPRDILEALQQEGWTA